MVHAADTSSRTQGTDASRGRSGDPRHAYLVRGAYRVGGLGRYFWGTWAAVPFFIIYGAIYGGSSDSRWHECGHRTAFKTQWMNDALYEIACFMVMREPEVWR